MFVSKRIITLYFFLTILGILYISCFVLLIDNSRKQISSRIISPIIATLNPIEEDTDKTSYEVFGFAPYWNINKLDNIDYSVLTTLAYFGVPVLSDGSLDRSDYGYTVFQSRKASELFSKAHSNGTRVVLTITQMDNSTIKEILSDEDATNRTIEETVSIVKERGIDGVNIDFEYSGTPGSYYRERFNRFVEKMTSRMHSEIPSSFVTVSVYAGSAKDVKMYDVGRLSDGSDAIFMMAYDFATTSSDNAMPTAPLNGHREGKYWYDIATAVDDFLKVMPADKLILGVPYYGYNYPVTSPKIKAPVSSYWSGRSKAQVYSSYKDDIVVASSISKVVEGWDKDGKVGYKAYQTTSGAWRMVFTEDVRSLSYKYDFAKEKGLKGVGVWALGMDDGKRELWDLLSKKFGSKELVERLVKPKAI